MFDIKQSPYRYVLPKAMLFLQERMTTNKNPFEEALSWTAIRFYIPCAIIRQYHQQLMAEKNDEKTESND